MSDADLRGARETLRALVAELESLVVAAEDAEPPDPVLVSTALIALRRARHDGVWAAYVLHQRLPPPDLVDGA
jgi:hypothetical protein